MGARGKVVLFLAGLVGLFWMLAAGVLVRLYEAPRWLMGVVFVVAFGFAVAGLTICTSGEVKDEV